MGTVAAGLMAGPSGSGIGSIIAGVGRHNPSAGRFASYVDRGDPVIVLTGRAGTGKTTLIRDVMSRGGGNQVLLAPTGIAALNAGGQTIHSFFSLPLQVLDREAALKARSRKLWRNVERIIIDEISMVRADMLDAIDIRMRHEKRTNLPFGGAQMVLVGDFLQLPPVVPRDVAEVLRRMDYQSGFAFDSHVLRHADITHLRLEQIHRQSDPGFIELLGSLRQSPVPTNAIAEINRRCLGPHRPGRVPMILGATNQIADFENFRKLQAIAAEPQTYGGKATGTFDITRDRLPVPMSFNVKPGARVMALRNDPERRWVNGSLGTVVSALPEMVTVRFDHSGEVEAIRPSSWEKVKYAWEEATSKVNAEIVGAYTQMPLALAWAATIHKAQGLSIDDVRIDIGQGAFASGQAYVALSRATSIEGLSLARPLERGDFFIDPAVESFEASVADRIDYI